MINHFKYLLLILFSSFSFATTIHVATTGSDDTGDGTEANPYATIQKGSDEANNGDTVLVGPGTYEELILLSNEIFLVSQNGPDETIINGTCPYNSCTVISSSESLSLKINGFTIKGGKAYNDFLDGPGWIGGAIGPQWDTWNVDSLILKNLIFIDNENFDVNIGYTNVNYLEIKNSTFIKDEGQIFHADGIEFDHIVSNSIFFSEQTNLQDDFIYNFSNCLTYGGVSFPSLDASNSNLINVNPHFCDSENGDFSLIANSPAIGAGTDGSNIGALGTGCDALSFSLTINEIMNNPSAVSDSDGEWFEIYNNGDVSHDLNGWTIKDNGSDSHVISSSLVINPGEFKVLSNNPNQSTNGGLVVDYQYNGITLANGDDELVLIDPNGTVFDSVAYDGGPEFPDLNGASMGVIDSETDNNLGSNWQASTTAYGDGDLGTPGLPNFSSDIDVELTTIDFDTVLVGESSNKVLTISNTGNTTLLIDSIYTSSGLFTLPLTETSVETSLELTITFTPSAYGIVEDTLVIKTNDPDESHLEITLIAFGYVPSPNIVLESTSIDFGTVMDGLTETIELHIANDGDAPLSLSSVYIEGPTNFTILNFSASIAETDTGSIDIQFSPDDETSFSGALYIVSNDPDTDTLMVPLSGIGGNQAPIMILSDDELYFGTVQAGTTVEREVIIYNEGMIELGIEEITISGSDYYTTTFSDGSVEPGDSVIVPFSFAPTEQVAEVMATATVFSNVGTQTIELEAGYFGPVWHVATTGSDDSGDGTEANPYATIQKGVDISAEGDTVLVHPGTYEAVNNVNDIFLISTQGPEQTVIDANFQSTTVMLTGQNIFISGFTIVGGICGYNEYYTGSMRTGGGIGAQNDTYNFSSVSISNMIFYDNEIDINLRYGTSTPVGTAIISNSTFIFDRNFPTIETLTHPTTVTNCIFIDGGEGSSYNISFPENESLTISHSLFFPSLNNIGVHIDGGTNIVANPLFCDSENGNYSLASNSPAIGAGENGTDIGALGVGCGPIYTGPVWHVATTGSDETGDGSEENPFATIQYGIDNIPENDSLLIHVGTYQENLFFDKSLTLFSEDLQNTIIDGNGSQVANIDDYVSVIFDNLTFKNGGNCSMSYEEGIISGSGAVNINNCLILGTVYLHGGDNSSSITNSTIYSTGCIYDAGYFYAAIYSCAGISVENSIVVSESGKPIDCMLVFPNVLNNIIYSFSDNIQDLYDESNLISNPLFCDIQNGDFRVAENSPSIGAGTGGTNIGALGAGCGEILSIDQTLLPEIFVLHQNYPNPFNPVTSLKYDLPEQALVTLSIFDLMGREVRTLINSEQTAGFKNIQWNATDNLGKSVPAGMYIYTIQAGEFRQTRKMVLLK